MPVSVVCDAASVNAAIRESIANSSSATGCSGLNNDSGNLQSNLVASTKRVLLSKIEYEELNMYSPLSVFDTTVKSKCIPLEPISSGKLNQGANGDKDSHQNSAGTLNTLSGQQQQHQNNAQQRDLNNLLPQPKKVLFPRKNVQIGWKSSNRKWQVGAGMLNVGNTCYLNSTLQALFHVPAMANWLISDSAHREKCENECGSQGGCIICAMSKTLIASQNTQNPIRPYMIYSKLKLVCKHLVMGRQEDAHEFLRYLVEAMEKSYLTRFRNHKELDQYSKETTPLNQILGGYLKSAVRCLTCGHISTTFQHFQDILLDIRKANSIEEALDGYFSRERLEDMGYKCEACKKKVSATKQFSLERAPISLCIQLKRFSMMGTKLNKHVTIRPHLDLTPYASKRNTESLRYRLVAMVTHLGASQHCGHYTAIGYTDGGGYYHFDDATVRSVSIQNVLNTNAYIMFYELEDSQQHSRQTSTQVSGNHNNNNEQTTKINGQIHYNNNNNQQHRQNASTSNGASAASIKLISKLEGSTTNSTMIGPQLPEKYPLKNNQNTSNENQKHSMNGLVPNNNSFSKLVNTATSPNNKLLKSNNENANSSGNGIAAAHTSNIISLPKQKENQPVSNKLMIHFKNTTNNNNNTNGSNGVNTNNNNDAGNNLNNHSNGDKFQESDVSNKYQTSNTTKIQTNGGCNGISNVKNQQNNKFILPSMPRLESPAATKENNVTVSAAATSSLLQNGVVNSSKSAENNFSKKILVNGYSRNEKLPPVKSLVPYESDDDESDDCAYMNSSDNNKCENNASSRINHNNNNNNYNSNNSSNSLKRGYDNSDSDSDSDSTDSPPKAKQKTPPSPPIVKTKTGFWHVTSVDTKSNAKTTNGNGGNSNNNCSPEKKNPFATTTGISTSKFYSNNSHKININNNNSEKNMNTNRRNENNSNGEAKDPTVNHLLKMSHRGYGGPVLSWNGHKTEMEKEIAEETRLERKRDLQDDEENEMDRGRQKKIKSHNPLSRDNPGYNPFQEYQSQQQQHNQQNRRWIHNGHSSNNNNRSFHQNHNNNNNSYRFHRNNNNQNNFRRNRFHHQRPHHQRNGNDHGGFHHRRNS